MTTAPANLLAARTLLLDHLDVQPAHDDDDLESAEVGIVGDPAHRGGYHCGSDRVDADDYSVRESPRDKSGLTLAASALDVGWFEIRSRGAGHNLRTFSVWCVDQCRANAADTRDIREIIYSADGKVVKRWDRLGKRSTGDSSHLYHTHFSFFRDAVKAGRDQTPLFRRYLTEIGMIDMALSDDDIEKVRSATARGFYDALWIARNHKDYRDLKYTGTGAIGAAIEDNLGVLASAPAVRAIAALGKPDADEQAIVSGILAVLTPEAIANAIPDSVAADVATVLAQRLAS